MILHLHDSTWSQEFQRLRKVYLQSLGELVERIEHVGSTAIEGIAAKPILDIDLVISTKEKLPAVKDGLEKLGYQHNGDQGISDREVFKRIDETVPHTMAEGSWMKHHLYVCIEGTRELDRHTNFRDYLNSHASARTEYEAIKREIEARSNGDRKLYARIKEEEGVCTAFVERTLEKAEQEGCLER